MISAKDCFESKINCRTPKLDLETMKKVERNIRGYLLAQCIHFPYDILENVLTYLFLLQIFTYVLCVRHTGNLAFAYTLFKAVLIWTLNS